MADKLDPKELVSFKELLLSNVYTQETLMNLLEKKGILTKKEVLEDIKRIQLQAQKKPSGKSLTAQTWIEHFFIALDKVYERDRYAAVQWTYTKWTEFLGKVLEEVGDAVDCFVAQKRKDTQEGVYSGEYLNIDAMFIDNNSYKSHQDKDWDPYVLPKAVVELENSYDSKKIIYCLWKTLCIRSPVRVLACYQENQKKVRELKKQIEDVINKNGLMVGEQGSLLVLIGNEEVSEKAGWNEYFSVWAWEDRELKQLIRSA